MKADIAGISRLRIGVDGEGVTTLVAFMLCPLQCKYCLNPQTLSMSYPSKSYTPEELYAELKIDALYFLATGGGVTFGGGEPLLRAPFIAEFRSICGKEWKLNLETSLNVSRDLLETAAPCVDSFIVDIKDMNPETYASYTGGSNSRVLENLRYLVDAGRAESCVIKVPLIPGYNSKEAVEASMSALKSMGFNNFDKLKYKTEIHGKGKGNL